MAQTEKGSALVTGASSGIGAVYADRLARRGYDLILVARDEPRLDGLAEKLHGETGRTVEVIAADLVDPTAVAAVAERIAQEARLALIVNNAGMAVHGALMNASADWETMQAARLALHAQLSRREVAPRYRTAVEA
jgi:short-subunit dehydrogenase